MANNLANDRFVLLARTGALGFERSTTPAVQDHVMRVVLCAAAGEMAFEMACDAGSTPCELRGVRCPRAVVSRSTCIVSTHPCARALVNVPSNEYTELQRSSLPAWVRIPLTGAGFRMEDHPAVWGTSWLRDALIFAGRRYSDQFLASCMAETGSLPCPELTVNAASIRSGGWMNTENFGHQTGLQIRLTVPKSPTNVRFPYWEALRAQADALREAGFRVAIFVLLPDISHCKTIVAWLAGVRCGQAPDGFPREKLVAALEPGSHLEMARSRALLPRDLSLEVVDAATEGGGTDELSPLGDETGSGGVATIRVTGRGFGRALEGVLLVAVGDATCTPSSLSPPDGGSGGQQVLVARCRAGASGLIRGRLSVLTGNGGLGESCAVMDVRVPPMSQSMVHAARSQTESQLTADVAIFEQRSQEALTFEAYCTKARALLHRIDGLYESANRGAGCAADEDVARFDARMAEMRQRVLLSPDASEGCDGGTAWASRCAQLHGLVDHVRATVTRPREIVRDAVALSRVALGAVSRHLQSVWEGETVDPEALAAVVPLAVARLDEYLATETSARRLASAHDQIAAQLRSIVALREGGPLEGACRWSTDMQSKAQSVLRQIQQLEWLTEPVSVIKGHLQRATAFIAQLDGLMDAPARVRKMVNDELTTAKDELLAGPLSLIANAVGKVKGILAYGFDKVTKYAHEFIIYLREKLDAAITWLIGAPPEACKFGAREGVSAAFEKMLLVLADQCGVGMKSIAVQVMKLMMWVTSKVGGDAADLMKKLMELLQPITDLMQKLPTYIRSADGMMKGIADMDGFQNLVYSRFKPVVDSLEVDMISQISELNATGQSRLDAMVFSASAVGDGLVEDVTDHIGEMVGSAWDEVIPSWLPPLLEKLHVSFAGVLEALASATSFTEKRQDFIHLLSLAKQIRGAVCAPLPSPPTPPILATSIEASTVAAYTIMPEMRNEVLALGSGNQTCLGSRDCLASLLVLVHQSESRLISLEEQLEEATSLEATADAIAWTATSLAVQLDASRHPILDIASGWAKTMVVEQINRWGENATDALEGAFPIDEVMRVYVKGGVLGFSEVSYDEPAHLDGGSANERPPWHPLSASLNATFDRGHCKEAHITQRHRSGDVAVEAHCTVSTDGNTREQNVDGGGVTETLDQASGLSSTVTAASGSVADPLLEIDERFALLFNAAERLLGHNLIPLYHKISAANAFVTDVREHSSGASSRQMIRSHICVDLCWMAHDCHYAIGHAPPSDQHIILPLN